MADLNQYIFEFFFSWSGRGPLLDAFFIFLGRFLPYVLIFLFLVWAFSRDNWKIKFITIAEGAMAVILSRGIMTELIGFFYPNPRPFIALNLSSLLHEFNGSFPSGHAAVFFALAMTIFYYNRKLGWWYLGLSLVNGIARIIAGVHWPLDILGGMGVGILSAVLIRELVKPHFKKLEAGDGVFPS